MKLGYNTNGFAHHRLEDAIEILAELGYRSVALTLDHHALNPHAPDLLGRTAELRELLQFHRLAVVVETGARFFLDARHKHQPTLISPTAEERETRIDFLFDAIHVAAELGAPAVSFWSGTPVDSVTPEVHMDRLANACLLLCQEADRKNVRLAFEPEPGMLVATMSDFVELHRRVGHPRLGLTLDVGHLFCNVEASIPEVIHQFQGMLWNVHIEDMRRGVHDHLMFGEGEMDFAPILKALQDINYEGGVHVELSRHSHDAVNAATRAREFLLAHGLPQVAVSAIPPAR